MRRVVWLAALLALLVPATTRAAALSKLRFVYYWPSPDLLLTPIAVGEKLGLYRRHGLDIALILPPDAQTTARLLASGQGDIGIEDATDVIFAASISLPLISIASYDQHNSWCLLGRPGEPIDLRALKGKKVAIFADSWTALMMRMLIEHQGLHRDDISQIMTQFDDYPLLLAGRIDLATSAVAFGIAATVDATGRMPTLSCRDATGVPDIPIWSFTTTPTWLRDHAPLARAFLAATREAMRWSLDHPGEAAAILNQAYPQVGSLTYSTVGWRALVPDLGDGTLRQSGQTWQALAEAMRRDGQISDISSTDVYFTNEYLGGAEK